MENTLNVPGGEWPPCDEELARSWKTLVFPTYVHVIHDGPTGRVPGYRIDEQLEILNSAFAGGKIQFDKVSVEYRDNGDWFRMSLGSDEERAAKAALHHRDSVDGPDPFCLNLYTANLRGSGANGYARQPWEYDAYPELDGIAVHYEYLPGGPRPFNKGGAAVHEVGHWLGLHHTFEHYGHEPGDYVPDTPLQVVPSMRDCNWNRNVSPRYRGQSPQNAYNSATNYMDLSSDDCRDNFTLGQFCRIRNVVLPRYKDWLLK